MLVTRKSKKPCRRYFPPKKRTLTAMLVAEMRSAPKVNPAFDLKFQQAADWIKDRQWSKEWMLKLLSQINEEHLVLPHSRPKLRSVKMKRP